MSTLYYQKVCLNVLFQSLFSFKFRSSRPEVLCKKDVLRNFARPATLLKKRLWNRGFPVNFMKFLRTPFLQNASGRLPLPNFNWHVFVQCDFLLAVFADILVWQVYYFIGFFCHGAGLLLRYTLVSSYLNLVHKHSLS